MNTLFSPIRIGQFNLNNRIGFAPMSRLAALDDTFPARCRELLVNRAESGCAIITTEALAIKTTAPSSLMGQSLFYSDKHVQEWRSINQQIRRYGAVPIIQLNHSGRLANDRRAWNEGSCISSGDIPHCGLDRMTKRPYVRPKAMMQQEINQLIESFVCSAKQAVKAGFAGIEINCAHGYLLNQFIAESINNRQDCYGGNIANRFKIVTDLFCALRVATEGKVLLSIRLSYQNSASAADKLFNKESQLAQAMAILAKSDIDIISLSCPEMLDDPIGYTLHFASLVRKYWSRYLFAAGGIHNQDTANRILNYADIAMVGKSLLLTPQWIELAKNNWPLDSFDRKDCQEIYGNKILY
ncbi:oxidoreductase [Pragia fontium]|uniref:2,4-dienoyl-CoA reductase n=1 Tax=Pragia fontium DSM 5563 = ATCC 49100 TaxID=1122977 RepID=A0AAJ4W8K5_9GAMM|nr:hypothetical protein [Pragia fontium]SFC18964.1 2,4-dienoyl-CoA reductase [Pragia fontium DSM 5563 = ATCC 49100]VEJ53270.1 NADPH dehydrogenase [Pragia fontium]